MTTLTTNAWRPDYTWTGDPRPGGSKGLRRERVTCWACLGAKVLAEMVSWSSSLVKVRCYLCGGRGWVER